jgi:hypothetical protein
MRSVIFLTGAVGGMVFALAAGAAQLSELPEGPDRNLVLSVCQSCHDLTMVFGAAGISRSDWDSTLREMTDNGMEVSAEERGKLLDYLSTYLGPSKAATAR